MKLENIILTFVVSVEDDPEYTFKITDGQIRKALKKDFGLIFRYNTVTGNMVMKKEIKTLDELVKLWSDLEVFQDVSYLEKSYSLPCPCIIGYCFEIEDKITGETLANGSKEIEDWIENRA